MSIATKLRSTLAITTLSLLIASPTLAQGRGNGRGNQEDRARAAQVERERPTLQRRGEAALRPRSGDRLEDRRGREDRDDRDRRDARREDERWEDRRDDRRRSASWEDILFGREDDGRRRDVPPGWCKGRGNPHNTPENCGYRSDRRYDWDSDDRYGGFRSYADAHRAFHRALDREYVGRAAERRNDPMYQLRLRAQKASDHERWHERTGTRH